MNEAILFAWYTSSKPVAQLYLIAWAPLLHTLEGLVDELHSMRLSFLHARQILTGDQIAST